MNSKTSLVCDMNSKTLPEMQWIGLRISCPPIEIIWDNVNQKQITSYFSTDKEEFFPFIYKINKENTEYVLIGNPTIDDVICRFLTDEKHEITDWPKKYDLIYVGQLPFDLPKSIDVKENWRKILNPFKFTLVRKYQIRKK